MAHEIETGLPVGKRDHDQAVPPHFRARPIVSKVIQNEGRHDNEISCAAPDAAGEDHVAPFQSVERPRSSTAMQDVDEAHDVAAIPTGALDAPDQAAPFQVKKLPPKSVAMQNVEEVHETTAPI